MSIKDNSFKYIDNILLKYIFSLFFAEFILVYSGFIYAQGGVAGYEFKEKNPLFDLFPQNIPQIGSGEHRCLTQQMHDHPMFIISGPTMSYDMLPHNESTARKLIFQGEIMIAVGKIMVEEGESLKKILQTKVNSLEINEKIIDAKIGPQLSRKLGNNLLQDEEVELAILTSNEVSEIESTLKLHDFSTLSIDGKMIIGVVSLSKIESIAEIPGTVYLEINSQKKIPESGNLN